MKTKGKTLSRPRQSAGKSKTGPAGSPVPQEFPIVGVGASAGGLEALTQLLRELPLNTGFGYVLVQHLDPQHESALAMLLARTTSLPVLEVTNNMRVLPNHVYIIPPNTSLGITGGVLKLQPRLRNRLAPRSIDFFFEALAKDQHERAIGIILSGTATDGTLGLEMIKAEGGLTFAQDDTARYDSMPRSAVAAGCVDFVLSPENIAKELARIAKHPYIAGRGGMFPGRPRVESEPDTPGDETALPARGRSSGRGKGSTASGDPEQNSYRKILLLLRNHSGVDFSHYKPATIQRRIARRTVLARRDTLETYAEFLRGNAKELDALYSDALISVTSFFRNPDAFDMLKRKVFARLLQERGDDPLRIWVLGCSTGQEAYSLTMAYAEAAEKIPRARKLQVFATDLNDANLDKARHGLYAKSIIQDVSPERLRRFFVEEEGGYRVIKSLRELVVFARHNLINDPPFSRMDLICCRNLMIYLEPSLQKKALPAFHYALKPEGFLFLGASESVGGFTDLFTPLDKKQKIFSRKSAPTLAFHLPVRKDWAERRPSGRAERVPGPIGTAAGGPSDVFRGEISAEREADRVTVNRFAPPSVLIDADLQILQFRGATGAYLEPPTGKARFDLLKMSREGLMLPLRAAIHRAKKENKPARAENVPIRQNGTIRSVNVEVVPLTNLKERRFLVLFEDSAGNGNGSAKPPHPETNGGDSRPVHPLSKKEETSRIASLELELGETRDYLQSVQEQQDAANEELQASNEEGQSANEELQSLNEELETSKEELESTNEELTTVNEEMTNRNAELSRLNGDLTNLQSSTKLVIVLLGRDLTIRRFSSEAARRFHLMASDLGRSIGGLRHNLHLPNLEIVVGEVIATVHEFEREVQATDGRWYSLRIRPYLTVDNKVDGAVLVLVDIDDLKRTERLITEAHEHAAAIIRTVHDPLVILSADLRIQSANEAFYRAFKLTPAETKARSIFEIDHGAWNVPRLHHLLAGIVPRNSSFNDFAFTQKFGRIGRRSLLLNARALVESGAKPKEILLGIQDITEIVDFQTNLRRSEMRYRRLFEAAKDGILILDPQTRKITDANPFIVRLLGYTREQLIRKELWQIGLLKDEAANQAAFRELKRKGFIRYEDLPLKSKAGVHLDVEFVSNLYDEDGVAVIQCNIRDITERKASERNLVASEARFRALFDLGPVGVYSCDASGEIREFNRWAAKLWGRRPKLGDPADRYCGSFRMHRADGSLLPHRKCPMAAVLEGRIPAARDMEVVVERRNGSRLTVVVNIVPLRNEKGEITGAINCFYDITERKQAEEALRTARAELARHAGQLEGLVAKRTAALVATNRQLNASVISIQKGKEQYQALHLESLGMQKRLRQLTHQIITAQEEERRKISRELHDEIVQTLVGINVELSALVHENSPGVSKFRDKIAHTQRLVEASVDSVHRFARDLRPAVLDDLGLIPALHTFCRNLAGRKQLKIAMTAFAGVEKLGGAKRTVLFRVAQEALTNIARHARATHAQVNIRKIPGAIRMEIKDNGQSFPVEKTLKVRNNRRLGLVGMKERVEMVGGSLVITSIRGQGTTVCAEIPY